MGVLIGPGRGSAAGSAVAYCIGITNIDPIKYNLLFERFLNPERKSMPDIDTDFDDVGREKVMNYVINKYGKNQVAQIINYGTMAAKSAIKDVARALDLPLNESNELAKLVPDKPGTKLKDAIDEVKELKAIFNGEGLKSTVLKEALNLEGSVRNTGIHASAVIIAPSDLLEHLPLSVAKDSDLWVTQWDGNVIESAGLLKMDFLGLKTLSIINDAVSLIAENHGVTIVPDEIPLDDLLSYKIFQNGETVSVFQFESDGMQKHLKDLKPDKFEDIIAMVALYRPGPMAYIPDFVKRKHGLQEIKYDFAVTEDLLADTYGITIYQEQVMLLSQRLASFSKGDADVLRKAMGKKQMEVLQQMKGKFMEGCAKNGHDLKVAEKVWVDWEAFASYAFNKSHATCYAYVAFHTAYLKAHYPAEFMAAVLNAQINTEQIAFFMEECKRMGMNVLGPDINESASKFTVNKKGQITTRESTGNRKAFEKQLENTLKEEEKISNKIDVLNDSIFSLEEKILNIKSKAETSDELGPLKYLANLTGYSMDIIINWFILVIILVFDPLAISLVIAANFAFNQINPSKSSSTSLLSEEYIIQKDLSPIEISNETSEHNEISFETPNEEEYTGISAWRRNKNKNSQ
jgi:DNA polymerase-3 subunit alpha